jgi:hypothetical protein
MCKATPSVSELKAKFSAVVNTGIRSGQTQDQVIDSIVKGCEGADRQSKAIILGLCFLKTVAGR